MSEQQVEDAVQDVFARIVDEECRYSRQTDVKAYLTGIANRIGSGRRRAMGREVKTCPLGEAEPVLISPAKGPLECLADQEVRAILRQAIDRLPPKSRQAIELVYMDGLTPFEAAAEVGCGERTIRDRLDYGRAKLRTVLLLGRFPRIDPDSESIS